MNSFKKHKNITLIVRPTHKNLNPSQLLSSILVLGLSEVEVEPCVSRQPASILCLIGQNSKYRPKYFFLLHNLIQLCVQSTCRLQATSLQYCWPQDVTSEEGYNGDSSDSSRGSPVREDGLGLPSQKSCQVHHFTLSCLEPFTHTKTQFIR